MKKGKKGQRGKKEDEGKKKGGGKSLPFFFLLKRTLFSPLSPQVFPSLHFHFAVKNGFINHATRAWVSLLGPCFKTGRTWRVTWVVSGVSKREHKKRKKKKKVVLYQKKKRGASFFTDTRSFFYFVPVFAYDCETHCLNLGCGIAEKS